MTREEPGDTRSRIIETARELFTAQTYRAASMRDIAARVGITKPSLYHHFRSKSELLASLIGPPIDELEAAVDAAAARQDPAERRLRVLEGCLDVMLAHRATMALLLRDASVYGDETTEVMSRVVDLMNRAVGLLAGPDPDWRHRVRAAQAFAAVTDPISQLPDVPTADLRTELLHGATTLLGL
ncbi:DNA-binding transcriptional regulator, AcrR family [Nonomuraea solani]|uniref:DNA-binding transcriptional regulator, AcrR family n=1 Tax=Nonomuraea solani TaxID=1144553 RepID=A0A1H5YZK5_9ACTN|nr:TetR/AcrR family transcriptional regulator [Nonomuraea solani]SEG29461.1 DNA-binding transcriptional regulator, AcrR family [Nonomuraea solani]